VIERIFGVIKKRWAILNHPAQFDMTIQARIPPACAALHNFIMTHDSHDVEDLLEVHGEPESNDCDIGTLAETHVTRAEKLRAEVLRDKIAEEMWTSYQDLLHGQENDDGMDI
jgi:hypothetical protein